MASLTLPYLRRRRHTTSPTWGGNPYTQVGTEGGGLVITGDVVATSDKVPNVVGERANPALAALTAAGLTGATSPVRNPLYVYVVWAKSQAATAKVAPARRSR